MFTNTFFPIEPLHPEGSTDVPAFIAETEEAELLSLIKGLELHPFHFQRYEAKRKVASFGYDWGFDRQQLSEGKPIPKAFAWLIERAATKLSLLPPAFAELLVTE